MWFPPGTVLLTVLAAAAACAQEQAPATPAPAVLENSGKPMLLRFRCTEDDIQWAGLSCSANEPCPVYLELAAASRGCPLGPAGSSRPATYIPWM